VSQQLDISTLERLVIEQNLELLSNSKQIEIAKGQLEQSRILPNPIMKFESGTGVEFETTGMISQTIILGKKRKLKIKLNELYFNKERLEYEILKQAKLTEVFKAFVSILHLQEILILQKDRITVADNLMNAVSRKVEAGKLSPAEKSRARIQLFQERLKLRSIEKSLQTAWNSISVLWGDEKSPFNQAIGDLSLLRDIPILISLEMAPDIQIFKLSLDIQQQKIQSEKAEAIPDLDLGAGLKRSNIQRNTFQVGLSIPLPIFNRNQGNIKSAILELEQAQLELKRIESQLKTDVSNFQAQLENLVSEITIIDDDIIPEAQNAYTIITDGYLNGRFTYLDVVNSQEMWFQSREQYVNALKDYHTNLFELDRITGNTNYTNFKEKN
tara:strand:- start:4377 stop:5531 length:1155 start_codon:yes stop_codon:yes gene_type:complete